MPYDLAAETHASGMPPIFADAYRGTANIRWPACGRGRAPGPALSQCPLLVGLHPSPAVRVFERQWLVNLILWGNYARLRDAVLAEMGDALPGRTLQVACVLAPHIALLMRATDRSSARIRPRPANSPSLTRSPAATTRRTQPCSGPAEWGRAPRRESFRDSARASAEARTGRN
jgi:hypothetical protein